MLTRILELKQPLAQYAREENKEDWNINYDILQKVVAALQPFKEMTLQISGPDDSLANVIPRAKFLQKQLEKLDAFMIGTFVTTLQDEVASRFAGLEEIRNYAMATFLDPRYKSKFFSSSITVTAWVKEESATLQQQQHRADDSEPVSKKARQCSSKDTTGASSYDDFIAPSEESDDDVTTPVEQEIDRELTKYLGLKRVQPKDNPLSWWKDHQKDLPELSRMARKHLGASATSVPSEQLFSGAGIIFEPLRNRLHGETAEKLLFIKFNLPIIMCDRASVSNTGD